MAELDRAPGKYCWRLDSKAFAAGAALAGEVALGQADRLALRTDGDEQFVAVRPDEQCTGVGKALIENAHHLLKNAGEELSVVLGDPAFDHTHHIFLYVGR